MAESTGGLVDRAYEKLASGKIVLIFGIAYLINQIVIGIIAAPLGADMLGVQITLSAGVFSHIVQGWTPEQLAAYHRHFYPDMVHPFIYAIFLSSAIAALTRQKGAQPVSMHKLLFVLPFAAGACDLVENCLHLYLTPRVPDIIPELVTLSGAATNVKWMLASASVGAIIYLGVRRLLLRSASCKKG